MAFSLSANHFLALLTTKPNQNPHNANLPTSTTKPAISTHLLNNFNTPFELKQLHAYFIKTNTSLSLLPLSRVAHTCSLSPDFSYAHQIFQQSDKPEIHVWNSCLKAFAESNSPSNAIQLFVHLLEYNILPDVFTCSFVLKACTSLSDISFAKMVHGFVEKMGFKSNDFLQNMFLHLYASCGDFGDASRMFGTMSQKDVVSWNTMITQLVKRGDIQGAYDLFCKMPEKNTRSWASMISGFVQCRRPKEAIRVFLEMEELGMRPNEVTVVAVFAACADLGALELGRRVHEKRFAVYYPQPSLSPKAPLLSLGIDSCMRSWEEIPINFASLERQHKEGPTVATSGTSYCVNPKTDWVGEWKVPTLAIKKVFIANNTSVIQDEVDVFLCQFNFLMSACSVEC
ncbi:Pentatricopeptide repeat [Dillenia turbinata]|uniref:Pentatricopeptide repeat n=1 Tax=Dillenia turbinata TaxID=194707 RepID=A0AAN8W9I6_9MAGN